MSRIILALSAATLAISAPALADKEGKGGQVNGGGNKGGQSMKSDRGADKGNRSFKNDRGPEVRQVNAGRGNDKAKGGNSRQAGKARSDDRFDRRTDFGRGDNARLVQRDYNDGGNGCPPGLDKKDNGCLPPGQARKYLGARIQRDYADSLIPYQYRSWYRDDDNHFYRSGDGYMYRVSRNSNLVDGIIPLFSSGGYYSPGQQWPDTYDFYNVPQQYRSYYADGGDMNYRYGDGAIYRVNSRSNAIESIVALLAGDLGVGSQLPNGYDAYNVPLQYRDRYADSNDNWYRYNDGYIYQVDPKTRLISAVIDAIA